MNQFVEETGLESLRTTLGNLFATKYFSEEFLPSNIKENTYLYLENHDNLSIKGRLETCTDEEKEIALHRVIEESTKLGVGFKESMSAFEKSRFLIEIALASRANHVTLTMQDILFRGKSSRINVPGTVNNENWSYRFLWHDLSRPIIKSLHELLVKYNRNKE